MQDSMTEILIPLGCLEVAIRALDRQARSNALNGMDSQFSPADTLEYVTARVIENAIKKHAFPG